MNKIITASNLNMQYSSGTEALRQIDLSIKEEEFVAIVGPSGCGKSTLLKIIAGLITTGISGKISVSQAEPNVSRKKMQQLAFVFQEANLLPWRNILSNVKLPLELRNCNKQKQMENSISALELVDLQKFTNAYPHELSGGMKMRVSLARALVTQPKIMLLDEPFGALDEITRQKLNEELIEIWQKEKWTALFVTHNIMEAIFLSNRILIMSDRPGNIIADITIPFTYPRKPDLRLDPDFVKIAGKINHILRETTK